MRRAAAIAATGPAVPVVVARPSVSPPGDQGRFRFAPRMNRSAGYRPVWREPATDPEGPVALGIDVRPRIVDGGIYPRRPAVVQPRISDGWRALRRIAPTRRRLPVAGSTGRLDPGARRLRPWVPRDARRRLANSACRRRGVPVHGRFVNR